MLKDEFKKWLPVYGGVNATANYLHYVNTIETTGAQLDLDSIMDEIIAGLVGKINPKNYPDIDIDRLNDYRSGLKKYFMFRLDPRKVKETEAIED